MNETTPLLGILGGLGPMSTVYFCQLLIEHTDAACDADHINMLISSRATTPDRTAFILGRSSLDPLPVMTEEAHRLCNAGADLIVIPCNTAHYFYDGLAAQVKVPMINIIEETVRHLVRCGVQTFGLLATEGTVTSRAYEKGCHRYGLRCITPTADEQTVINSIIYDSIKQNISPDLTAFLQIIDTMRARGCQRLVLGCTELSLLKPRLPRGIPVVDSLEVLAFRTIRACKKHPIGFDADFYGEDNA